MRKIIVLLLSLMIGTLAFAQRTTSTISGHITDNNEESIPYVYILATHQDSNTQYTALSNENGYYTIDGMRPGGPYIVKFTCLGYETRIYSGIFIGLAQEFGLDVIMKETIEDLQAAVVESESSSYFSNSRLGAITNITNKQIITTPTEERTIAEITRLSVYGGNGMNLAGGNGRLVNFTVDGANFNNNLGLGSHIPAEGSPISLEALAEVQVVVSPYDVRQNNFTVAGINAVTKSGTNKYEGSVYQYLNKDFHSTTGITLSGPIVKNKLFAFVNFEILNKPNKVNRWTASKDGIASSEYFISRTSVDDLQRVSDFVKSEYGYDPGSFTNYPSNNRNIKLLSRIDWNINQSNKLSIRYNHTFNRAWNMTNGTSVDGAPVLSKGRSSISSMVYSNSLYAKDSYVNTWSINLNSRLNTNLHNEFLATYSMINDRRFSNSEPFPFIDILKSDETGVDQHYISLGYEPFSWNNHHINNVLTAKDDLRYYIGEHKLMLGISFESQVLYDSYMRNGYGYYRYDSVDDFLNRGTPNAVCLTYGYDGNTNPGAYLKFNNYSAYIQDEWSINDNFKIMYGLRLESLVYNNDGLITNPAIYGIDYSGNSFHHIDGTYTAEQEAMARRIDTGRWPNSSFNFSPRFGFEWDVFGNKSLRISGGTGVFTGRIPLVLLLNMPTNSGALQYQAILNNLGLYNAKLTDMTIFDGGLKVDMNGRPTMEALRDFIITQKLGEESLKNDLFAIPSIIAAVDPNFKMPQTWKTTLTIDYKFPTEFPLSLNAEAIYNKTITDLLITDWSIKDLDKQVAFDGIDQRHFYNPQHRYLFYYDDNNKYHAVPNAFVLGNTNKGYGYILSLSLKTRPVEWLNLSLAYTHTKSYTLSDIPDDKINSVIPYVPNSQGFNYPSLHSSHNIIPNRILFTAGYQNKKGTAISLIYEAIQGKKNYTYMTANDLNADGYQYDVVYIPNNPTDMLFISNDDRDRFWDFVNNDHYLSSHKGQYASAYTLYSPWYQKIDLKISQDINFKIGSTSNTIQLSVNFSNFLNLINPKWGLMKVLNPSLHNGRILKFEDLVFGEPRYSTPTNINKDTSTWVKEPYTKQYWGLQFGIKYIIK